MYINGSLMNINGGINGVTLDVTGILFNEICMDINDIWYNVDLYN